MVMFIDYHGGEDDESELVGVGGEDVESDGDGLWDGHGHHGGEDEENELVGVGLQPWWWWRCEDEVMVMVFEMVMITMEAKMMRVNL